MKKIKNLIFDLDGTLTDPKIGITNSFRYAMEKMGLTPAPVEKLQEFIGPPLKETFVGILQTADSKKIDQAIVYYREYFGKQGKFENEVYPEILETLKILQNLGKNNFIATSKALVFAKDVVTHFSMEKFFVGIYGSDLDNLLADKGNLLAHLLKTEKLDPTDCVMIGDREHDIIGAKKNEMRSICVTYGYGKEETLKEAKPDYIVHSPRELLKYLT